MCCVLKENLYRTQSFRNLVLATHEKPKVKSGKTKVLCLLNFTTAELRNCEVILSIYLEKLFWKDDVDERERDELK